MKETGYERSVYRIHRLCKELIQLQLLAQVGWLPLALDDDVNLNQAQVAFLVQALP